MGGEWQDGLPLFTDHETNDEGFRGSAVLLEPDTEYEIELSYAVNGTSFITKTATTRTWSEAFPIAQTISVTSRDDLRDKLKSGSRNGYVVFDGNNKVIDGGKNANHAIELVNFSYVILRNMKITGGKKSAVRIKDADHIVVENCDIYKWGENKTYCGSDYGNFIDGGKFGGVYVESSGQVVVQHNKIHDPAGNSCNWSSVPENLQDKGISSHPAGPRGIALTYGVEHSVFRYNRVYADKKDQANHYFSDVFNGEEHGTGSDIDVYGNEFSNAWDDGIEIEGENKNIRVWGNVVRNVFQGFASDRNSRTYYGPVYVWRNIFTDLQTSPGRQGGRGVFKLDNRSGRGGIYLFNNTVSGLGKFVKPNNGVVNQGQYNLTVKNNILEVGGDAYDDGGKVRSGSDLDYNAYSQPRTDFFGESYWNNSWEANGQFNVNFTYQKGNNEWDYYVQGSGKGAGTRIPNFIEPPAGQEVDLGAAQAGVWSMCVGPNANCNNNTNPPPPADPLPEPDIEPIQATYAPFFNQFGHSFWSTPKTYWTTAPTFTFTYPPNGTDPEDSDNQVTLRAVWDQDYLTVAVEVADDDSVAVDTDKPFKNDGIELFFDVKNGNAAQWEGRPNEHKQFIIDFRKNTLANPTGFEVRADRASVSSRFPNHRYEVRIPWTSLGIEKPEVGLSIGFDVANNDRDQDGKVHFTYTGRTQDFLVPGKFARLELIDTPPVEVAAAAGAITVDGKLDEEDWQLLESENGVSKHQFLVGESIAYSKMLWTPEKLYVGVRVLSDELVIHNPDKPWFNDGVELLFDTENNRVTAWDTDQGHKQLIVDIAGNTFFDPLQTEPNSLVAAVGRSQEPSGEKYHYTIEIGIDWSSLGVAVPRAGDRMSFDLVHNDRDTDQYNSVTLSGRTNGPDANFKLPSEFVDFVLVETVNRASARTQTAVKTLAPERTLTVYPNPSGGKARLRLSGFEAAQVQITDLNGKVVYRARHTKKRVELTRSLLPGLYIVRVSDAQKTLTQKLLVE